MSRWGPNARGRLEAAALDLYSERGFEQTTVADIAARAGLTERTYFRHFADKREALFGGSEAFQDLLVKGVVEAPLSFAPLDVVAAALETLEIFFAERLEWSRKRQRVIVANAELQERDLVKFASLAAALTEALRERGVGDPAAGLTADAGMAVFKVAFQRWLSETNRSDFRQLIRTALEELKGVIAQP